MRSNQIMDDQFYIWYIIFILIHWGLMILYSLAMYFGNQNAKYKNTFLPRMRLVGLITWFIFIIPVGVNYSKVFWCLPWTGKMDVANDNTCWTSPASKVSKSAEFTVQPIQPCEFYFRVTFLYLQSRCSFI